ncbi:hypothetical protein DID75_03770 [Candidatus Marinamargulisbacteria bacterium SCGC AG-410-N11]|nr:hypothetical protein DID75_03770 [Candidatus Marinamargulisbacteria bacterium SCGC AG-410-N11]
MVNKTIVGKYTIYSLLDHLDTIDVFINDMKQYWTEPDKVDQYANQMKTQVLKCSDPNSKVRGLVAFDNEIPVGICWTEVSNKHYGHFTIHTIDDDSATALIQEMINQKHFDQALLELVQIKETPIYRDTCLSFKLIENERKRMACWLDKDVIYDEPDDDIEFFHMSLDTCDLTGKMSYDAHQVSHDYDMYPEMNNLNNRIALEKRVFGGLYGKVISETSIMAGKGSEIYGYILYVEVSSWGFEKIPWIFDIVVNPAIHGMGVGRRLLTKTLNKLTEMDYPIVGLAVSLNNVYAIRLYEKLRFIDSDIFYEYIQ